MALHFDLRNLKNREDWDTLEPSIQDALILRLMAIGMRKVEGKVEVQEYYTRNALFTALYGGIEVTPVMALAVDGLSTNVSPETSLGWRKRITEQFMVDKLNRMNRPAYI